jgi:photosynthetic reaction center cytochrome c subunit
VISRYLARFAVAALTTTLALSLAGRAGVSAAQQPPAPAPQGAQPPQGPPGGPGGRGGFQLRNVQVLKDVPPDQFQLVMQYVAASLGVQCNYCHVMGDNASDDKDTKKTARKMMQMVADLNKEFFAGKPTISCASCHNGHPKPSKVTPLAVNMTQDEAAAAAAARGRRGGGPGGGGAPGAPGAGATPPAGGAPGAAPAGAPGRGPAGPPPPPAVTETVDQVVSKYVQALGGQALQNARTRVMTGTVTNRDLTTANVTVTEKSTGESRIEIATQPNPTIRATNGTAAWQIGGGGFGGGANARDITGFQVQQGFRLADFALPLNLKQRYQNLSVKPAYETIDGKQAVVLTGTAYPNVTEDLAFDRDSGLLLRRTVTSGSTTGFGILALGEQIDYSDYRDVSGVKVPFTVKHSTWNAVTTEKFTDVKINAPVNDSIFAKPAPQQ